jgi:hypothetical protein
MSKVEPRRKRKYKAVTGLVVITSELNVESLFVPCKPKDFRQKKEELREKYNRRDHVVILLEYWANKNE